jgi:hypothetical protein
MDTTGYVINTLLVLIVLRQVREARLDMRSLALPAILVGAAAACFLRSIPIAGNDAWLELTCATAGLVLGTLCASFSRTHAITSGAAWTAALVNMALAELPAPTTALHLRARAATRLA